MGILTLAEFKKYAKKMDEDATGEALYQAYLDAAESVVSDFLSYPIAQDTYTHTFYGDGKPYLALKAQPVVLASVTVGGVARSLSNIAVEDEIITDTTGNPFPVGSLIVVVYDGGFDTIPGIVKVTVLEIAALLSMEAGENIGVTGTSFDGGNTRNFINYTKFDKYLQKLERYRIRRLPRMRP
jgi:membrane-associated protease RseP (regulator of RpoE activity)